MNMTDTGEDGDPEQGEQAMIVVGICDGEQTVRSLIAGFVEQYHAETGVELRLLSYNTGEKLLKNYMLDMDLIFLEIPFRNISAMPNSAGNSPMCGKKKTALNPFPFWKKIRKDCIKFISIRFCILRLAAGKP